VDSPWDAVHTVIRPIGGALIATSTHAAKAGTRAVANTSPEPFSNWALSFAEDGFVITLGFLALSHPFAAAVVVMGALAVIVFTITWLVRRFRSMSRVRG
jgi:hypothetical protein